MQQRAAVQRAAGVAGSRAAHKALVDASATHRRDVQTAAADVQLAAATVELASHSAQLANQRVGSNAHCFAAEAGAVNRHSAHAYSTLNSHSALIQLAHMQHSQLSQRAFS